MNAVTIEGRSKLGATMRAYGLKRALFATAGVGAMLAVSSTVPHEAIPQQIVTSSAAGMIAGTEYSARLIEEPRPVPGAAALREQRAVAAFIAVWMSSETAFASS